MTLCPGFSLITMTTDTATGAGNSQDVAEGKVIREDVFECLSKNKEYYRLVLTTSKIILHHSNNHSRVERYPIEDVFGCHTLRHKKQGHNNSAYICFYLYPKSKKKSLMSNIKFREKLTLVFEVKKGNNSYEKNLEIANLWKKDMLSILGARYPKWQLHKSESKRIGNDNKMITSHLASESEDVMDRETQDFQLSLSSYLLFLRRFLVILNPKSGKGKTIELFKDKVSPVFKESGIKIELMITQYPGHARNIMSSADLSEVDGIVTIGGDGILYEVVNGLRSREDSDRVSNIPIGVVAGGSGNGLARSIAEYSSEADDYLKNPVLSTTLAAARGKVMEVNLAEVDLDGKKIYSFLSVGWGLLADIDVESEVLRALGEPRFTIWSFYRLATLRSYKAKLSFIPWETKLNDIINGNITVDDNNSKPLEPVVVDGDFVCVYSAYQSYIGSDLVFAPKATPNDGLIHLVYLPGDIGRTRATQFLISIDKGTHLDVEGVKYVTVKEFTIERDGGIDGNLTVDGELVAGNKINVKLSPKPLNMFAL